MKESTSIMLDGMIGMIVIIPVQPWLSHYNEVLVVVKKKKKKSIMFLRRSMEAYRMKNIHHDDPMKDLLDQTDNVILNENLKANI
jgi:hypothetical protein